MDSFRDMMRDMLFVQEPGDEREILEEEAVLRRCVCSVAHPGLCKMADADIFRQCSASLPKFLHYLNHDARAAEGHAVEVCCFNEAGHTLHTIRLLVAYVRKRDPILAVFAERRGSGGQLEIIINDGLVSLLFATEAIKLVHKQPNLTRASVKSLAIQSVVGQGSCLNVVSLGAEVDLYGGTAGP